MIKAVHISQSFGDLEVLRNIDFEIRQGEIISIVGPSGAGKTTLLQIMGTLSKPTTGEITYDGKNVNLLREKHIAEFRNKHIGFVFQFHHLLPEFTALENVCIPAFIARVSRQEAERKAVEILQFLKMGDRLDHKPNELSGGELQRVAVARALINDPTIILADEPSGNLDTQNKEELHGLFFTLRERYNPSIVIVTHDHDLAGKADRKLELRDGIITGS
ncbi:MAG TPA: ABC transporter ATP-binding protein [Bacteroidales bacterium]|nr:ABC transporter ATP-binding protein [Bacteroidales bacterium]